MKLINTKITLEYSLKLNPRLNPELFLPDPRQVLEKLDKTPIKDWLKFISEEYTLRRKTNLILIPCSFYKPYNPPHDEFYRRIINLRRKIINSKFITVSVPLALEPEEYWSFQWRGFNLIYDCPFFPWIEKYGYKWDEKIVSKILSKLEQVIDRFFERNADKIDKVIVFLLPSSDELKLVENHVTHLILKKDPKIEVSYDNNTSEIYCLPENWGKFTAFLKEMGLINET